MHEDLKRSDAKILDDPLSGPPVDEKNPKLVGPFPLVKDEEDVSPICLEEYGKDNPKIVTNCGHHFHLSCVLEWMERQLGDFKPTQLTRCLPKSPQYPNLFK